MPIFNKKPIQKKKSPISVPNQYRIGDDTVNRYFKMSDVKNFVFYKVSKKVSKALFEEKHRSVQIDEKMLYVLLLDRIYLYAKNSWIDKQGTHFNATDKENVIQQFEESLTELKTS